MSRKEPNTAKKRTSVKKAGGQKKARFEKVGECLYRYVSNGVYYAVVRHQGKLTWKSLKTDKRPIANRKLADHKAKLSLRKELFF